MSKASELLNSIVIFMPDSWHEQPPYYKTKYGVGKVYERFTQEQKDILKTLKSDDIKNVLGFGSRRDWDTQCRKEEISKLKLEFDKYLH